MAGIIGLDQAPTTHRALLTWVRDVATLTDPDNVVWYDGSDTERDRLIHKLIEAGTFIPQQNGPRTFRFAPDPDDVAELGRNTYVCTRDQSAVDPAVNWMEPVDMKIILTEEYRGCMTGRTMYVVPFRLGASTERNPIFGVQITDSEYVVVSMHVRSPDGEIGPATIMADTEFVRCLHSIGAPRRPGQADVPWPCDHTKYIAHFPETRTIWSYGSGFAGNAVLGTDLGLFGTPFAAHSNTSAAAAAEAQLAEIAVMQAWLRTRQRDT